MQVLVNLGWQEEALGDSDETLASIDRPTRDPRVLLDRAEALRLWHKEVNDLSTLLPDEMLSLSDAIALVRSANDAAVLHQLESE